MSNKLLLFLAIVPFVSACNRTNTQSNPKATDTFVNDPDALNFDIEPVDGNNPSAAWIGTYVSQGKTARFRVEFGTPDQRDTVVKNLFVSFGKGRFVAVKGSDASVLLVDLKKVLEAKKLPSRVQRVAELPFSYANFEQTQTRPSSSQGIRSQPDSQWTAIKIFLGEGDQECEFFINFNTVLKKGQFSLKDEEYGDEALARLAKVL